MWTLLRTRRWGRGWQGRDLGWHCLKFFGCCLEKSLRGLAPRGRGQRPCRARASSACVPSPAPLTVFSPLGLPEHGEAGRAVGDPHRGLWRVVPDPAHAPDHLRLRVEVVSSRGARAPSGGRRVPARGRRLTAPSSSEGAMGVGGPRVPFLLSFPASACHLCPHPPRAWLSLMDPMGGSQLPPTSATPHPSTTPHTPPLPSACSRFLTDGCSGDTDGGALWGAGGTQARTCLLLPHPGTILPPAL